MCPIPKETEKYILESFEKHLNYIVSKVNKLIGLLCKLRTFYFKINSDFYKSTNLHFILLLSSYYQLVLTTIILSTSKCSTIYSNKD